MTQSRPSIVNRLANLVVGHPWRMLIAAVALFVALVPGTNRLEQDRGFRIWFQEGEQTVDDLDQFETRFGAESASLLIVHSPSGIFDPESAQLIVELTDRMWKVAEVVRVESLANFDWVRAEGDEIIVRPVIDSDEELTDAYLAEQKEVALGHEQLPSYLISPDGKTAVIYAWLQPAVIAKGESFAGDNDFVGHVDAVRELMADYRGKGDHEFYLGGFPVMERYMQVEPGLEMQGLTPIILGTIIVLLLISYRRPAGLLPLVVVVPSVAGTMGVTGWLGIGINPLTVMAPNIIVILAISNSVHLLQPYFRALSRGVERREAARYALNQVLKPNFFALATTAIGFLGLLAMTIPPIRQLGVVVAIGTMLVMFFIFAIIGPLMVVLPIKAKKSNGDATTSDVDSIHPRALRLTKWLDRYKLPILGSWLAILAVSGFFTQQNEVRWKPTDFFAPSTKERQAQDFLKEHVGVAQTLEISIEAGQEGAIKEPAFLRKVEQLGDFIASQEGIVRTISLVDILKETNRALFGGGDDQYKLPETRRGIADQYLLYTMNLPLGKNLNDRVTFANDALRMTVLTNLELSPALRALEAKILGKAKELGIDVVVTGRLMINHHLNPRLVESVTRSIIAATIMIAIALLLLFRSLRLGLLSLVLNIIPLVIGSGIIFKLLGEGYNMGTISAFAIALGVAVDDTVHFLSGFKTLRDQGYSPRECITRLWSTVVPAMVITTVILAVSFALFILITFPVLKTLGVLIAFVLIAAFFTDAILLPCVLLLLNRKEDEDKIPQAKSQKS